MYTMEGSVCDDDDEKIKNSMGPQWGFKLINIIKRV